MALVALLANLEELARERAGGRHDGGVRGQRGGYHLDGALAGERGGGAGVGVGALAGERPLAHEHRRGLALGVEGAGLLDERPQLLHGRAAIEHQHPHADALEQLARDLPLEHVLRLVVHARLAAPADHEKGGDGAHGLVGERAQRIDRVADAAVLHVDDAGSPGGQPVAARKRDGPALVGGDHVLGAVRPEPV